MHQPYLTLTSAAKFWLIFNEKRHNYKFITHYTYIN